MPLIMPRSQQHLRNKNFFNLIPEQIYRKTIKKVFAFPLRFQRSLR